MPCTCIRTRALAAAASIALLCLGLTLRGYVHDLIQARMERGQGRSVR
ncbi:MAG: hypothetical protein WB297_10110 [Actinomycetota bacterium]